MTGTGRNTGGTTRSRDLAGLLPLGGIIASTNRYALVQGDLALPSADWRIATRDADGAPLVVSGRSAEVARRQADGRWLYLLDRPFGA